jgi:hypothetical protein
MDEDLSQGNEGTGDAAGAPDAATLEKAKSMGWAPKEKWRGDPNEWVDAGEFLARGERLMPILRANNRKLEEQTQALEAQNRTLAAQLAELRGSMDEFVEAQREAMQDKLKQQRADIRRQLREARDQGDDAAIERLEATLDENDEQRQKLAQPAKAGTPAAAEQPNPAYEAWKASNPWFQGTSREDQRKTALAMQFGREAAAARLAGKAFFDYVDEQMEEALPARATTSKVEGGRPSGSGGGTGFDSLPAEAKAQARKDALRFVGPNKVFKTEKEYFAHFTKLYNGA